MSFFKEEWKRLLVYITAFLIIYHLPIGSKQFDSAVLNSIASLNAYFKEHFLFGLFPAMFIAGALSVFLKSNEIIKYMGAKANKFVAYLFASVSGLSLTVCSCTVMPLFAGIYKMGAGLGPAVTFLFAAPAINLVALTMTTSVLGLQIGIARAVMSVFFSFFVGIFMAFVFRKEEVKRIESITVCDSGDSQKPFSVNLMFFASMIALFVFAKLHSAAMFSNILLIFSAVLLIFILAKYFKKDDYDIWFTSTFEYIKKMVPLLTIGIAASAFLMGFDGKEGIIPASYISTVVGGNGLKATFISSFFGAFMYFCTLIEVPIVQGFMNNGMGKGPALALLLAGPALSLPNMLLIRSVLGNKKTAVYVGTVIILATVTGYVFGNFF
ncbi:MAG: permease [Endomicrobia bacterium]|nr:permease [Endomicrobiia bacterium]MCL2506157.1 permease [Endomicrobiia bacterium]